MAAIEVEGLKKTYRKVEKRFLGIFPKKVIHVPALRGVSFSVEKGELVGYLGPNGSGKSTTLKILAGILHPDKGRVSVLGFRPWERKKEFLKRIGVIFGHRFTLFHELPVEDSYLFHREVYGVEDYEERLEYLHKYLGILDYFEKQGRELSLGERVRCELCLVLLHDPEVVLLDEPMIGVDIWTRSRIREMLSELKEEKAILLSSHQLEDVEAVADRIILLDRGRIAFEGTVRELKEMVPWKRIVAEIKEEVPFYVVKRVGNTVEMLVEREKVEEVVKALLEMGARDIIVEEPSLEEVLVRGALR